MSSTFHRMAQSQQPGIGKMKVGEPPPPEPGKTGITVRVAIFFDGTKNNRTNTAKRRSDPSILNVDGHKGGSSYGNFYSNPAIHEFMNNRRDPAKHEVSHYVEGIGTRDFVEGATEKEIVEVEVKGPDGKLRKEKREQEKKDRHGRPIPLSNEDNGQDDMAGNGFGAGPTGIREKVDSGIEQLKIKILLARGKADNFYIEKIILDVFGFSRGAAAARHFIHRRNELRTWPDQRSPAELVINFVGLYDTVSSYAQKITGKVDLVGSLFDRDSDGNTDRLFCDDVQELGLNLGGVPKKVIHLTAGDEQRRNFSLTNINSSLKAGVGFELTLPGVHSDIGGSYVEAGQGALNEERRVIPNEVERRRLITEGWYTDGSPGPDGRPTPNQLVAGDRDTWQGVRSLPTDYQFITLKIMHDFATCGGKHEALDLGSFADRRWAAYRIPPPLAWLGGFFSRQALRLDGSPTRCFVKCPTLEQAKWLRNHYLHRSAKQRGDGPLLDTVGMEPRINFTTEALEPRLVIPDDDPHFVPPSLRVAAH